MKTTNSDTNGAVVCADCHKSDSQLEIRKRWLCYECFQKYINSKILKRMESYRFKNQVGNTRKRLFLPLSGGVSSLALLQVLDHQVKRQLAQQGRTAYDLVIGYVDVTEDGVETGEDSPKPWFERTKTLFENHQFISTNRLSDALTKDGQLLSDLQHLGLARQNDENDLDFMCRILQSPKTVTSKADLQNILQRRLIVALAKANDCESIVWGHSDSRLAAQALAEVAKGRGAGIPNVLSDGLAPSGLYFNYPVRDLFKSELDLYVKSLPNEIQACQAVEEDSVTRDTLPVSIRSTSIDQLLSTYITSQGEKYPSIMANVVKTASKLQMPRPEDFKQCHFCALPITTANGGNLLCYGCERMKQDIRCTI